jgi:hypothetical protein
MTTSNTRTWLKRLWHLFTNWMLEPIPFPGMTYNRPPRRHQNRR